MIPQVLSKEEQKDKDQKAGNDGTQSSSTGADCAIGISERFRLGNNGGGDISEGVHGSTAAGEKNQEEWDRRSSSPRVTFSFKSCLVTVPRCSSK